MPTNPDLASLLLALVGAAISLIMTYVPGASDWYEKLDPKQKALTMLGLLALATVVVAVLVCTDMGVLIGVQLTCTQAGITELLTVFLKILIGNQLTYLMVARPKAKVRQRAALQ